MLSILLCNQEGHFAGECGWLIIGPGEHKAIVRLHQQGSFVDLCSVMMIFVNDSFCE